MDKKLPVAYAILGTVIALISPILKTPALVFSVLLGLYIATLLPLLKKFNKEDTKTMILDTLLAYLLTWMVVFFLVSNLI